MTGVGARGITLYAAATSALFQKPDAVAIAFTVVEAETVNAPKYTGDEDNGVVPSKVKWMIDPGVVSPMETVTGPVYLPGRGENVGGAAEGSVTSYAAVATALFAYAVAIATAFKVIFPPMYIGMLNEGELALGVDPSSV
jgi:hypothetical protein